MKSFYYTLYCGGGLVLMGILALIANHALSAGRSEPKRPTLAPAAEYRCDHERVAAFTTKCAEGSFDDKAPVACVSAAKALFCDTVAAGSSQTGRKWVWYDGRWILDEPAPDRSWVTHKLINPSRP